MAFVYKDRVRETTTTTGTGTLTLAGAVTGFQAFSAIGNGNTCCYVIEAVDANNVPTGDWECGIGTYTASGTTLARTTVVSSSNSGSAVNLAAGTKQVYCTVISNLRLPTAATVDGTAIKLAGKETIGIPAGAWKAKATGGATAATYQDVDVFGFNGTTATRIRALIGMPKSWNESTITFKAFGIVDTGGASGNVAVFKMAAKAFGHDDPAWTTADLSTGAQSVQMAWTANDDVLISGESSALTIDGTPAEGDIVLLEFWRDPADAADNNTAEFIVTKVHVYFSTNAATDD